MRLKNIRNFPIRKFGDIFRAWLQAFRVFSWTASMVPVVLGAAWAVYGGVDCDWRMMPLIIIASFAIHAATNLINDYVDYFKGVDKPSSLGGSRVIVEGKLSARQVLVGSIVLFGLTAAIGLVFITLRGWPILWIGVAGMLGGIFYSVAPIGYKYRGLGDALVFLMMGPLMVIGSYFVLTGEYHHHVMLVSLPIGCLVAAILSGNNLRDIEYDTQAGIKTTAGVLGRRLARIEYCGLVISAYLIIVGLTAAGVVPVTSLASLVTVPMAYQCIRAVWRGYAVTGQLAGIDAQTAKVHLAFGMLQIITLFIEAARR